MTGTPFIKTVVDVSVFAVFTPFIDYAVDMADALFYALVIKIVNPIRINRFFII